MRTESGIGALLRKHRRKLRHQTKKAPVPNGRSSFNDATSLTKQTSRVCVTIVDGTEFLTWSLLCRICITELAAGRSDYDPSPLFQTPKQNSRCPAPQLHAHGWQISTKNGYSLRRRFKSQLRAMALLLQPSWKPAPTASRVEFLVAAVVLCHSILMTGKENRSNPIPATDGYCKSLVTASATPHEKDITRRTRLYHAWSLEHLRVQYYATTLLRDVGKVHRRQR